MAADRLIGLCACLCFGVATVGCGSENGASGGSAGGQAGSGGSTEPGNCPMSHYDPQLVQWTKASDFVFRATVTRLNATTEPSVSPMGLYVARVDHQILGDDFTKMLAGSEVTIKPPGAIEVTVGTDAYFFTSVAVVGNGVVVREVGRAAVGAYATIETDVPAIEALLTDRAFYDDLISANLVAVASVASIGQPQPVLPPPDREHDPWWTDATVMIKQVLHDTRPMPASPMPNVAILRFASSTDVAWYQSPKLMPHQTILLVAHEDLPPGDAPFSPRQLPGAFDGIVYHPQWDVRAPSEQAYVARLLQCPPPAL